MTIGKAEVLSIHAACVERYGADGPECVLSATRTEVYAALQLESPPPYSEQPDHIKPEHGKRVLTHQQRMAMHEHQRSLPTDAECLASERARAKDPGHVDAHHFVQKRHQMDLWAKTDQLLKEAGVTS